MAELEYLGGHPDLLKPTKVSISNVGGTVRLRGSGANVAIPARALVAVRLERNYRRSAGGAAVGAVAGALLLGPIGAIAGAVLGGSRKDDSVIVLAAKIDGITTDIVFAGDDVQKQYAQVAASVQRAKAFWSTRLTELVRALQTARQSEYAVATGFALNVVDLPEIQPGNLHALSWFELELSSQVKSIESFVSVRSRLVKAANEYVKATVEAKLEDDTDHESVVTSAELSSLSSELTMQMKVAELKKNQAADIRALVNTYRKIENSHTSLNSQGLFFKNWNSRYVARTERLDSHRARMKPFKETGWLEFVGGYLILARIYVGVLVAQFITWWLERRIESLSSQDIPRLQEQASSYAASIQQRQFDLASLLGIGERWRARINPGGKALPGPLSF